MVKPLDNIETPKPMRDVRLAEAAGDLPVAEQLSQREQVGYERGRQEASHEFGERLQRLRGELDQSRRNGVTNLLANLERSVQLTLRNRLQNLEHELIEFSTEAAIRLVHNTPITTSLLEAMIHEAVADAEQHTAVSIHLHPEDLKMLQDSRSELLADKPFQRKMNFIGDPKVDHGGCLVDTDCGVIDGQRQTRMDLLKKALGL